MPAPARSIGAVLVAALLMSWPAVYNGYPLLYPDSMSYLRQGAPVARALFLHRFAGYYGGRSLIYSVGILPFHWNVTPWPVVTFNALSTAYVLWLVVRSLQPGRTSTTYLALVALLSVFTGLGWFVGWIMPDIFGPVLYLAIYLLVFAPETLSRAERRAVVLIAWWSLTSHITHLMLAAGLCVLFVALLAVRRQLTRRTLRPVGTVALIVFFGAAAQMALHTYLYGEPSLNGQRPPFVMARMIADGPGRWYLRKHCPALHVAICAHSRDLPDNVDDFLWSARGIWQSASLAQQDRIRKEETRIVLGTLRAYPREELVVSAGHFWRQLHAFGLWDYDPNPWILAMVDTVLPGGRPQYLRSRQARETLHEDVFTSVQDWTVLLSLVVIACWGLLLRQKWSPRVIWLATIIGFVVVVNAAVTGVLANVEDRYQARVIWLVPLLAAVLVLTWIDERRRTRSPGAFQP
ncbi:MAG: hypothetical protein DMD33_15770 [Gemmatimonadetes bacterium]|nr:MAG: hypothetical protein DMD33_15770 [Gemmatimonadota bacterium]PYO76039.1 MAG: hypothetical protein DMD67_09805 [Gemmatimonadota bacterium]TLY52844.1 MAG: hypothetical protein E6K55_08750 [Gemmatimonadota bacterium]